MLKMMGSINISLMSHSVQQSLARVGGILHLDRVCASDKCVVVHWTDSYVSIFGNEILCHASKGPGAILLECV